MIARALQLLSNLGGDVMERVAPMRPEVQAGIAAAAPLVGPRWSSPGQSTSVAPGAAVGRGPVIPPTGPRRLTSVSTDFPAAEPERPIGEVLDEAVGALECLTDNEHVPALIAELQGLAAIFAANEK